MKNSIFAILACLILSCGVFAQGTYLENQKISAIISTIPQDLNTWSGEIKGTSDVDKAQVLQQIYNLYVTAHDGYSEYGSKAFSSGQNYKNIIDSLTPALLDPENNEDIRNPLDVYITLTAIYLYSYETSQSVQSNIKNKDVIVPDKTVLLMSDRLRDMGSYIEEKLNRYTAESFDDMLRDDIKKKHLVKTKEATYSKAYIAERDSLIARFNDSKQKIDDKSAELMKKFNSELMTQSTTDRTAALTSAKNSKDAEDKYNRINEAKKRTKDLFNKITNQYNNTQIALDNGLEKVNAAKTEYEQIKASNQQEDIETYKKNYEDALKKYNNTQQQLDNLKNRLKEITADLDTINANLNPVQEDFGKKKVIELDKRQMNTNATKQNFNDEEDIKNDLKDLKVNYDGNSPSFSVRIIGIHGSTIKWKANDNRIININNNIGIATVTRPTDANTDIILIATISKGDATPQIRTFIIPINKAEKVIPKVENTEKINKKIESTEKIKTETGSNEPGYTDAQILQNELNETTVSYDGTSESFKVDTKSKNASWPILWESKSDIISIDPDGTVTVKRPSDREQEVKLIATITDGNITLSKSFDICVTATVGQKTILLPIHLTLTPPFK